MDPLTAPAMAQVVQRLETLVTALEQHPDPATFSLVVLVAAEFARAKKTGYTLALLRRCLGLAQRLVSIRDTLVDPGVRWTPLYTVSALIHGEASRLSTLYGGVRPAAVAQRRALQRTFRTVFTHATGQAYAKYSFARTAQERTTITTFWAEALHTVLARFQAEGTPEALDLVMACLPAWADRSHERWSSTQTWREPAAAEVLALCTDYLQVGEVCRETLLQVAHTALAQAPVVERAEVAHEVTARYAASVQALQAQLRALPAPKDTPKAQQAVLRKDRAQLTQDLQALGRAQEAEITRRLTHSTHARHRLEKLAKMANGYPATVLEKVGKASVDVLPTMVWLYAYERQGEDAWHEAKREAKRFLRQVRQATPPPDPLGAPEATASCVVGKRDRFS